MTAATRSWPAPLAAVVDPFFAAAAAGRLELPRCPTCDGWHWYPKPACPHCGGEWSWTAVAPEVRVRSWITVHRDLTPAADRPVPHTLVLADVVGAPGVRLLVPAPEGSDLDALSTGARARLGFAAVPATGLTWPVLDLGGDR